MKIAAPKSITVPVKLAEHEFTLTCRHHGPNTLGELFSAESGRTVVAALAEVIDGWDIETPYSRLALAQLLDMDDALAGAMLSAYSDALREAREKN